MSGEESKKEDEDLVKILFQCPVCNVIKAIELPTQILKKKKHNLTNITIPSGLICEHTFQSFIDNSYKVRGYQKIDFNLSNMEYFRDRVKALIGTEEILDESTSLSNDTLFQDIIKILSKCIDESEVLGAAMLSISGIMIHSNLPLEEMTFISQEFETRYKNKLKRISKNYLVMENEKKFLSQFIRINNFPVIVTLLFSSNISFIDCNLLLEKCVNQMINLNIKRL